MTETPKIVKLERVVVGPNGDAYTAPAVWRRHEYMVSIGKAKTRLSIRRAKPTT